MTAPDLLQALMPVLATLRQLGVRHYVGGSIASSAHGVPRSSIDADVVADLSLEHAPRLSATLRDEYYVSEERARDAIVLKRSFNVIHLATMIKVDVFVAGARPFDRRALDRARSSPVEGEGEIPVCTAEDAILAKLEWYRKGGEVSERQWTDVLGVLRATTTLDRTYLALSAAEIGVADLLAKAVAEA